VEKTIKKFKIKKF